MAGMFALFIMFSIIACSRCLDDGIPEPMLSKEAEVTKRILAIAAGEIQARPHDNATTPTMVEIRAHLVRVLNVDSKRQSFSISAFLEVSWNHTKLRWNPDTYGGVKKIVMSGKTLWMPDIGLLNSMDGDFDFSKSPEDANIILYHTGLVKWYPGGIYHVGCHLDLTYFPFDVQKCSFYFLSWAYNFNELNLYAQKATMDIVHFMSKAEWDVRDVEVSDDVVYFKPGVEDSKWSILQVAITCAREPGYYVTNVIVPAIIISLLVLTVFMLPCDSGEKVSLGITVLVAFSVFQLVIADTLPKNSKNTPYIVIYLTTLMATTAITTLMSVVVLNIHHTGSERKFSPMLRFIIFNVLGRLTRYCRSSHKNHPTRYCDGVIAQESDINHSLLTKLSPVNNSSSLSEGNQNNDIIRLLQDILQETKAINERKEKIERDSDAGDEWKEAAKIVDRFLMLIYFIAVLFITVIFLLVLPSHQKLYYDSVPLP